MTKTAKPVIRAISKVKRSDTSRQVEIVDEFSRGGASSEILPPYDVALLLKLFDTSNMLKQTIDAMATNVTGNGFRIIPFKQGIEIDDKEVSILSDFLEYANTDQSFTTVHTECYEDYEILGYQFLEIMRDAKGRMTTVRRVPPHTMRMMAKDVDTITMASTIPRGGNSITVQEIKRFRRFVQMVNNKQIYYKEFGDPRDLDYTTGLYATKENPVPFARRATEILHKGQKSSEPYGVPRWINQLPSLLGSREAEEVNLRYFQDNTIPPIIMSVAGGRLTAKSFRDLENLLQSDGIGRDRQNKIILIEAMPENAGLDDSGSVRLQIDKLADSRQSDGLFKEYDQSNQAKVMSSFRLPPIAVGMSQEHTFATANTAAFVCETQVYAPARRVFDEFYNKQIINGQNGLNLKTVKLESHPPTISNPEQVVKSLTALNVMGALTPRIAREAANTTMQISLPDLPKTGEDGWEEWMDQPIVFITRGTASQAGQAVKDNAIKEIEADGNISMKLPEHGQE